MKKVLFATTALVATAGIASADVALSGSAEMGIFGGTGISDQFFTDIDVTFTMSGSTDNGLTFGASVDLDEGGSGAAAVANNADDGGATIFISGDFGTITMGDTDGALDWALTEAAVGNAGSIGDNETGHAGYLGSYGDGQYDGQILRYDYSVGDFGVAVSVEMDDAGVRDPGFGIGFRYGMDLGGASLALGLGYQFVDYTAATAAGTATPVAAGDLTIIGVSAAVTLDMGLQAGIQYSMWDYTGGVEVTHVGVGVGYTTGAITVSANYGLFDDNTGVEVSGYGLAGKYDLGGGLSLHLGYGSSDPRIGADTNSYSFGAAMSF